MSEKGGFINILKNLDRRIIFVFVAVAVIIPLISPIGLKTSITKEVQSVYDKIEDLGEGDKVIMSFEYDPASKPEIHPMALAISHHLLSKKVKIVVLGLWPMGPDMADQCFDRMKLAPYNHNFKDDNTTWVNMGYMSGGPTVIKLAGTSLKEAFPMTKKGVPYTQVPLLRDITNLKDFKMILSFSSGDPGLKQWVQIANSQYSLPVAGGVTAVSAPEFYPYYPEQMFGILGGLKAAAEYEGLINKPGTATAGMDAQSVVHLVIIFFIIIANVVYFAEKRRGAM
jgi:hypothetical protein